MQPDPGQELANYLRRVRKSNKLSQRQLAQQLGLADDYASRKGSKSAAARISKFENARAIPTDPILADYAQLGDVDADTLLKLTGEARAGRRAAGRPAADDPDEAAIDETVEDGRVPWWRRRVVQVLFSLIIVMAVGGAWLIYELSTGSGGSSLSTLYARDGKGINLRTCPDTKCRTTVALPTGTRVKMICFRDAQDITINYSSPRWFDVEDPGSGQRGWTHSSEVEHQSRVGAC